MPMDGKLFKLSLYRELAWFHEQMSPASRAYNFNAVITLRGELDENALQDCLAQLLSGHDALRLELAGGEPGSLPSQRIRAHCEPRFRVISVRDADDPDAAFQKVLDDEVRTPIDPSRAPLLRWCLVRVAPDLSRLVHVEHHLIHDGHSFVIILRDLFSLYRARLGSDSAELPSPWSYSDFLQLTARASDPELTGGLEFWHDELSGAEFELRLPGMSRPGATRAWSYAELDAAADRIAGTLASWLAPEQVVAVRGGPSATIVAVAVAVAKLGAAYLALGSSPGDQRLLDTVRRLGITCLIRAVGVDLPSGLAGEQIPLPVLDSGQPTVATIFCATWRLNGPAIGPRDTAGPPPIGRPVDGVKISGVRVEPAEVDVVPEFPLTSRGKINRAAVLGLRPSQSGQNLPDSADGPEVQAAILRICRDLLGQPAVSIGHSFADVGGNSLAAAMMLKAIEAEFGVRLRAVDVLRQPDLRSLARLIESWRAPTASETSPS